MKNMSVPWPSRAPLERHRNSNASASPRNIHAREGEGEGEGEGGGREIRRCSRGREVSSRYMFPTISSAAATVTPNSRPSSPNSRSRGAKNESSSPSNNSNSGTARSLSVERRRPGKADQRGSAGLWPSSSIPTLNTLADQLGNDRLKKKIENDHRVLGNKDISSNSNSSANANINTNTNINIQALQKRNNDSNSKRSKTPERLRTPPQRSASDGENTKPWNENMITPTTGKKSGAPLSKSIMDLRGVSRSSSLNLPSRSFRNNDIKLTGASVNVDNVSDLITPARHSLDMRRSAVNLFEEGKIPLIPTSDSITSDGSGEGEGEGEGEGKGERKKTSKKMIKGSYVPARFLQDTLSRLRRLSDAGQMPGIHHRASKSFSSLTPVLVNVNGSPSSSSWAMSAGRGNSNGVGVGVRGKNPQPKSRMSSMLNFGMELLKGKRSAVSSPAQEELLHQLRLLQNRCLQWRFVNARARASHQLQITSAQNSLYNVWSKTSELRRSAVIKRIQFQKARHQQKVNAVVAAHAARLEDWVCLKEEHEWAVTGTMKCLDAAIVRVPLVAGAKADVCSVRQVLSFAVDVMNGIQQSASKFLTQAEKVDTLLPELAENITRERTLLQECKELLAGITSLEVEERSLRTQLIQLKKKMPQRLVDKHALSIEDMHINIYESLFN